MPPRPMEVRFTLEDLKAYVDQCGVLYPKVTFRNTCVDFFEWLIRNGKAIE